MKSTTTSLLTAALGLATFSTTAVRAQTPAGFQPSTNVTLPLAFGNHTVSGAGASVPLSLTAVSPSVSLTFTSSSSSSSSSASSSLNNYILMMLDLDAPGGSAGDDHSHSPLLHWMLPIPGDSEYLSTYTSTSTTTSASDNNTTTTTTTTTILTLPANAPSVPASANGAPYVGPAPGAGTGAHRYVVLLLADPAGDAYGWSSSSSSDDEFVLPPSFGGLDFDASSRGDNIADRMVFDVEKFAAEGGFAPVVAGGWVRVADGE